MNRAPVALFALLCTLASSMVAAGVASDRPTTPIKTTYRLPSNTVLTPASFAGSSQEKWLTQPNWQAIDIQRAVALPTKKLPVRIPEKTKTVAAVIITIEQPQAPAVKTVATKTAAAMVPAAKITAPKTVAAKPAITANDLLVIVEKVVAATKSAPIQPRVTSSYSTPYNPTSTVRSVLSNNRISVADLHLIKPTAAVMNGSVTALPIEQLVKSTGNTAKVSLGGGKLQIAYGSLSMLKVGGNSFVASPYIADNASSILNRQIVSSTKAAPKVTTAQVGTWERVASGIVALKSNVISATGELADRFTRRTNQITTAYLSRIQTSVLAQMIPAINPAKQAAAIQSAQRKTGDKSSVKK